MTPWGYKAYVPIDSWIKPSPMITKFSPGHDYRILSNTSHDEQSTTPIEIHFSDEMNCKSVVNSISIVSTTADGSSAALDADSVDCHLRYDSTALVSEHTGPITGQIPSVWRLTANLVNVSDGVHSIVIFNATSEQGNASTNVSDPMISVAQCSVADFDSLWIVSLSVLDSTIIPSYSQEAAITRTRSFINMKMVAFT